MTKPLPSSHKHSLYLCACVLPYSLLYIFPHLSLTSGHSFSIISCNVLQGILQSSMCNSCIFYSFVLVKTCVQFVASLHLPWCLSICSFRVLYFSVTSVFLDILKFFDSLCIHWMTEQHNQVFRTRLCIEVIVNLDLRPETSFFETLLLSVRYILLWSCLVY